MGMPNPSEWPMQPQIAPAQDPMAAFKQRFAGENQVGQGGGNWWNNMMGGFGGGLGGGLGMAAMAPFGPMGMMAGGLLGRGLAGGGLGRAWDQTYGKHGLGGKIGNIWDSQFGAGDRGSWQHMRKWNLQHNPIANMWDETLGTKGLGGAAGKFARALGIGPKSAAGKFWDRTIGKKGLGGAIGNTAKKVGGFLKGIFSDSRLKKNIKLVGKSPRGINIYEFEYKNKAYGSGKYQGVMGHEVPWASSKAPNGYLVVDYDKLDVPFKQIG